MGMLTFLSDFQAEGATIPPLPAREGFAPRDLAKALRAKASTITAIAKRYGLAAQGNGKARRYSRDSAEAIRERLRRGRGPQTAAHYLSAVKQFTRWLLKDRRAPDNALAYLSLPGAQSELRHDRRALTEDELRALLDSAKSSSVDYRGLAGIDRHMLYAVAAATGFRKGAHSFACSIRAAQH